MRDKHTQKIYDKYVGKVQYIIDVVRSCENEKQLNTAVKWANSLFKEWKNYEWYHRTCTDGKWVLGPLKQFNTFIDWVAFSVRNVTEEKNLNFWYISSLIKKDEW